MSTIPVVYEKAIVPIPRRAGYEPVALTLALYKASSPMHSSFDMPGKVTFLSGRPSKKSLPINVAVSKVPLLYNAAVKGTRDVKCAQPDVFMAPLILNSIGTP